MQWKYPRGRGRHYTAGVGVVYSPDMLIQGSPSNVLHSQAKMGWSEKDLYRK